MDDIKFSMLDEASWEYLEREFSYEEIYETLKQCRKDKTPNPDGFNMGFLQKFWYLVKDDVVELFNYLHETETFVNSLNYIFFVLIAKVHVVINVK